MLADSKYKLAWNAVQQQCFKYVTFSTVLFNFQTVFCVLYVLQICVVNCIYKIVMTLVATLNRCHLYLAANLMHIQYGTTNIVIEMSFVFVNCLH